MPTKDYQNRRFDARPDRIDYRDQEYRPPLVSLPAQHPSTQFIEEKFPRYQELILDQGKEGSCTGFGLAAVINYLLWARQLENDPVNETVSPAMLYELARLYDEWPGEDYEGSSCRGAMKGWHKHGACLASLWPYKPGKFIKPDPSWDRDAAQRPLGAYYRINKDSILDMQAAIHEVGAIYCSSQVHKGWFLGTTSKSLPTIQSGEEQGGHAFAVVGYTVDGFIVQNSWGADWGFNGFATLPYEDWIQNGSDAWVAALGAPMAIQESRRSRSFSTLEDASSGKSSWLWSEKKKSEGFRYKNDEIKPINDSKAYEHSIVLGNDGRPLRRLADVPNAEAALKEITLTRPLDWLKNQAKPRIALYAHGGLNNEKASINRIRVMAPYFIENGIYPLFITWKTGFNESLEGMLDDVLSDVWPSRDKRAEGIGDWLREKYETAKDRAVEAKDRAIELACERLVVKSVWAQMKQNAAASVDSTAGMNLTARHLIKLKKALPNLEIHLVGHSAGSIILGHFIDRMVTQKTNLSTCTLFAPACTMNFAVKKYGRALEKNIIKKKQLHIDIMDNERELADSVGPYAKSLLYLVSRALETSHKTALLGLEAAWNRKFDNHDLWTQRDKPHIKQWRQLAKKHQTSVRIHDKRRATVSNGVHNFDLAHGSFDNDLDVVTRTLLRIRSGEPLLAKVENLKEL